MDLDRFSTQKYFAPADLEELKFYQEKYLEKKIDLFLKKDKTNKIPQTLHFIWLGPKAFPTESIANVESWQHHHPDWTIKFWTDNPDRPLPVPSMEKCLISDFKWQFFGTLIDKTDNWGENQTFYAMRSSIKKEAFMLITMSNASEVSKHFLVTTSMLF